MTRKKRKPLVSDLEPRDPRLHQYLSETWAFECANAGAPVAKLHRNRRTVAARLGLRYKPMGFFTDVAFSWPRDPYHHLMDGGQLLKAYTAQEKAKRDGTPVAWVKQYADGRPSEVEMRPIPKEAAVVSMNTPGIPAPAKRPSHRPQRITIAEIRQLWAAVPATKVLLPRFLAERLTKHLERKPGEEVSESAVRRRLKEMDAKK